jgi:hypothetical protein
MENLQNLITQLESKISFHEKTNHSVSNATVGWQIEHSLKTIFQIVQVLKASNPDEYKWKFNKNRLLISTLNFIPRGKAKAPKIVLPDENISEETLKNSIQKVRVALLNWDKLDKNVHFQHPYFGDLNKKSTAWFLYLHTKHHFKIVTDILKNQ